MNEIAESLLKNFKEVPVIPEVARKTLALADNLESVSFKELENIISIDTALTLKLLKVANSAFYGRQKEITSLLQAIVLFGTTTIKSLVLLISASTMFAGNRKSPFYRNYWTHSIVTAFLAKSIAKRLGLGKNPEEAFTSGLLHDFGQVILYAGDSGKYQAVLEETVKVGGDIEPKEEAVFGIHHRALGGYVLRSWSMPDLIADCADEHNQLNITSSFKNQILIVSAADLLANELGFGLGVNDQSVTVEKVAALLNLKPEDIAYYRNEFMAETAKDPYFTSCRELFGV